FQVQGWASIFLFATLDGTISGWAPQSNPNQAIIAVNNSGTGAVYTGLAISSNASGNFLFAADTANNKVDMYDGNFNLVTSFTDATLPAVRHPGPQRPGLRGVCQLVWRLGWLHRHLQRKWGVPETPDPGQAAKPALGFRCGPEHFWTIEQYATDLEQSQQGRGHQRFQCHHRPVRGCGQGRQRQPDPYRPALGNCVWRRNVEQWRDKRALLHRRPRQQTRRDVRGDWVQAISFGFTSARSFQQRAARVWAAFAFVR